MKTTKDLCIQIESLLTDHELYDIIHALVAVTCHAYIQIERDKSLMLGDLHEAYDFYEEQYGKKFTNVVSDTPEFRANDDCGILL